MSDQREVVKRLPKNAYLSSECSTSKPPGNQATCPPELASSYLLKLSNMAKNSSKKQPNFVINPQSS